jgi:SAM-dependent methyltransferase
MNRKSTPSTRAHRHGSPAEEGWQGWDAYAPFYDWENARTLGRRDVPFWQRLATSVDGAALELGCGTGRVTMPLARAGARIVGIDRSAAMLARARRRGRRQRRGVAPALALGDIRTLPFAAGSFRLVIAPYGILQSLLRERDLTATLAEVARVLGAGGIFAMDLVADLPNWWEYEQRVRLRGRRRSGGAHVTLIESVRQDRARGVTVFDQQFVERRGSRSRRRSFALRFRTLSVPQMTRRLEVAGFAVESVLGDYAGGAWRADAEVWLILARKR